MSWQRVRIDSIKSAEPYSLVGGPFGSNLTTRDYVEDGIPVIRGANLPEDQTFLDRDFVFLREEKADSLTANTAYPGDLVFTQRGTLGQVGLIPKEAKFPRYIISQSQMKLTVDESQANPWFVYYFFRHPGTVQTIKNHALTSGVPHINLGILKSFQMPLPPLPVQDSVVAMLSAYDDLIANNRRRMALLEEAARQLHRELFVRLHFPGHEHTRIIDGVPEGWERKPLATLCEDETGIQTGPFGSQLHQSDYAEDGVPVVMPRDLVNFTISLDSVARIPEQIAERLDRHRLTIGDTVYGRRGDIGRRAFIGPRQSGYICGTGCLRIRSNLEQIDPRYLFDALGSPDTAGTIANRAKGSTMPNLSSKAIKTVPVLVPPRRIQQHYVEQIEPLTAMCELLAESNQRLRTARDLLLPRLMSGEIAV